MTTTVGCTMVKDEADVIATTIRHMATQVDALIVADNMSTDGTGEIIQETLADLNIPSMQLLDDEVGYYQSTKMTGLARMAHDMFDADWIVPFDADEIWYSPFAPRIADTLAGIPNPYMVVPADLYDHVCTAEDPDEPDPVLRIGWRRTTPGKFPKVAVRWHESLVIEMGNHGAVYDQWQPLFNPALVVRHFPYRSVEQVLSKIRNGAAAYQATDLDPMYGAHWRQWGQFDDETIDELFHRWFYRDRPRAAIEIDGDVQPPLIYDPAPVQGF